MSIRDAFENTLIELNKVQAPSLLLDDFIYLFNKAIQQYVNERYNLFETKQLLTDDLRVLTRSTFILAISDNGKSETNPEIPSTFGGNYTCKLPDDYFHILNCVCKFKDRRNNKRCEDSCTTFEQGANKLDTNQWPHVINNYYMKPSVKQPYYYIVNIENPAKRGSQNTDQEKNKIVTSGQESRYGNSVVPIMLIKCGNDRKNFELEGVYIDYLRTPQYLSIDQDMLDSVTDNSLIIEFPDYVIYEIINQIVKLILENGSNPRIQTNPVVSKTIA